MARDEFQRLLDDLQSGVTEMGETVTARIQSAVTALEQDDGDLADDVVEGHAEVTAQYLALEQDCIDLYALQQPVASDLRFVAASFKILTELERISSLAANLGAYVNSTDDSYFPDVDLTDVGTLAREMLESALDAYETADPDACYAVAERDDELDGLCENLAARLIRSLAQGDCPSADLEPRLTEAYRLLLTIRDVERVGDHAVNIAARTLYMVENNDVLIH